MVHSESVLAPYMPIYAGNRYMPYMPVHSESVLAPYIQLILCSATRHDDVSYLNAQFYELDKRTIKGVFARWY